MTKKCDFCLKNDVKLFNIQMFYEFSNRISHTVMCENCLSSREFVYIDESNIMKYYRPTGIRPSLLFAEVKYE